MAGLATGRSTSEGRRVHRPLRRAAIAVSTILCIVAAASIEATLPPAGASVAVSATMRAEIDAAFGHLVGPPKSLRALRPYVEGIDAAMVKALAKGAVQQSADASNMLPDGTMRVSAIRRLSATTASVTFAVGEADPARFAWRYVGSAIDTGARWKVSWVTVCTLVEQEGTLCPNPPPGVVAVLPLPISLTDEQSASEQSPDLVRPGALALTSDGDLLIADSGRDQILERHPNGRLSVFAGTGEPGYSGDGGPATDARLQQLGGMALAPDGTLYFVDGRRVRAIAPDGVITTVAGDGASGGPNVGGPALEVGLDPADVAVAKDGTLYIATGGSEILRLNDGVLSPFAKGGPPYGVDVATSKGSMAFFPTDMAFDGAGDLDVFSFSPKELFQVSPAGKITLLGAGYTSQLTTAPDGDVFAAGQGENVLRIAGTTVGQYRDLLGLKITGLWRPGDLPGLEPNGIAVAPSGAIYLDSFSGNGFSGGTSLVEITREGTAIALPIRTPLVDSLPAVGAPNFPTSRYPRPTAARGSDLTSCPATAGLEPFDATAAAAAAAAVASARRFNAYTSSLYGDLESSDRSWWKRLFADWVDDGYDNDTHTVVSVQPASEDTFAAAVAHACGSRLVRDSLVIDVGPSAYSFQVSHLYFLDRRGHPLVYFQAS